VHDHLTDDGMMVILRWDLDIPGWCRTRRATRRR
jgi:hypothetical protein